MNLAFIHVKSHHPGISKPLTDHFHRNKCFNIISYPGIEYILYLFTVFCFLAPTGALGSQMFVCLSVRAAQVCLGHFFFIFLAL